jgi:formate dehydrogenase (NADP+) beta subunit
MNSTSHDVTSPADLRGHSRGTGPTKKQHPIYVDLLPPCNQACPAGENIQSWLSLAQAGRFEQAWQALMEDNPMPAVCGRVCYHPCEDGCNREQMDSAVNIHAVERFLGDEALKNGWKIDIKQSPSGKRVLVVGAGPSGLSAAYHLVRLGHQVHIREAGPIAGGMMHFGIPAYRLPRKELEQEIARIQELGVSIEFNHKVDDLPKEKAKGQFDAVFVAVGAHLSRKIDIPSREAGRILDAVSFLRQVESGERPKIGKRVAIYGGGNTAMDAARTAKRLGASEAMIIYRRDRAHMAAHDFEAQEALEEGVKINWLRTIRTFEEGSFTVEVMRLENGKPVGTGEFETLEADSLILALGQDADTAFLNAVPGIQFKPDGTVAVGADMMTGSPGIFAGGDMVPCERTVTVAIGHGKKAARFIDQYLRGNASVPSAKHPVAGYEGLHRWYETHAPQKQQAELPVERRALGFDEVKLGLTKEEVVFESQRCLSCGNCFSCDGCYGSCPEKAIIKLAAPNRYKIKYDLCTGCAVCFEQCPCHAMEMVTGF